MRESIVISIVGVTFIFFQGCAYIEGVFKEPSSPPASKQEDKGVEQAVIRNSIPSDKLRRDWEEAQLFTSKGELEAALSKYLRILQEMGLTIEQKKPFQSYIITQDGEFFVQMVSKREMIKIPTH